MRHPPVEEILLATEEVTAHVRSCDVCVRIAALAGIEVPPEAPRPTFDRERYTDWRELADGIGGMGRAFRAWDRQIGREVVIKQPRALGGAMGVDLRARFEREALLTARLAHPGIVAVYEAGRFSDGEPFYAMPLVRGRSLQEEIAARRTLEERLGLVAHVMAICDAVAYAHEQQILHRDIKPANVIVGTFGETVLIDWGLAKDLRAPAESEAIAHAEPRDGLTQLGVGTAQYMPPEQAIAAPPDVRMDVYSLGATLYHAIAGAPPYGNADTARARRDLLAGPPAPLGTVAPAVAPALIDIVSRAMAREPGDRFQSARELADELRRFQAGQLVHSRRYTPAEIVRHFVRRHRVPVTVAAVATALLATVGVVSVVRVARASHAAAVARQKAETEERATSVERRRAMGVAASQLAFVPARRLEALTLGVRAVAPTLAEHAEPEAVQGLYDALRAGPALLALDGATASVTGLAFSPDGRLLAAASPADHALDLWDAHTGALVRKLASGGADYAMTAVAFSPDGERVVTWARQPAQVQLWPADGTAAITVDAGGAVAGAAFLADGTLALAGDSLRILDRSAQETRRIALAQPASALAATRDQVAVLTTDGDVTVWDAAGTQRAVLHAPGATVVAIGPDRVAAAGAHGLDVLAAGAPRHIDVAGVTQLAFSRSGRYLLARQGDEARVFDLTSTAPTASIRLRDVAMIDDAGVWTAAPGRLALLDPVTGAPLYAVDGPPGIAATAIDVDGAGRVAVATETAIWIVAARDAGEHPGHISEAVALGELDGALVSAGLDGRVRFGDASELSLGSEVLALATGPHRALVGTADGQVTELAGATHERHAWLPAGAAISALATSPDAARSAAARTDGAIVLRTGDHDLALRSEGTAPAAVAFSADGKWLASAYISGAVRLWDAATGALAAELPASASTEINGRSLATLAFVGATLYVGTAGDDTRVLAVPGLAAAAPMHGQLLAVSADGTHAATTDGATVLVHDLGKTAPPRTIVVHRPVTAAAFAGNRLAFGDADGVLRLVDLTAPDSPLVIAPASAGAVGALLFTHDGTSLVVAHASGVIRVHPLRLADALAQACASLRRFGRTEPGCP